MYNKDHDCEGFEPADHSEPVSVINVLEMKLFQIADVCRFYLYDEIRDNFASDLVFYFNATLEVPISCRNVELTFFNRANTTVRSFMSLGQLRFRFETLLTSTKVDIIEFSKTIVRFDYVKLDSAESGYFSNLKFQVVENNNILNIKF